MTTPTAPQTTDRRRAGRTRRPCDACETPTAAARLRPMRYDGANGRRATARLCDRCHPDGPVDPKGSGRPTDQPNLTAAIASIRDQRPDFGYRRVTALLRVGGWKVNDKRVRRLMGLGY